MPDHSVGARVEIGPGVSPSWRGKTPTRVSHKAQGILPIAGPVGVCIRLGVGWD